MDAVGVVVAQHENALVAYAGGDGESAGLVGKDLTGSWCLEDGRATAVGAVIGWVRGRKCGVKIGVVGWVVAHWK